MWQYQNTDELYHHGVLGMKWGVRRYQNADGSFAAKGQQKLSKKLQKYINKTNKNLSKRDSDRQINAYNKAADDMNNGGIEKYNNSYTKKIIKKIGPEKEKNYNYSADQKYVDGYNKLFSETLSKHYNNMLISDIKKDKYYKKGKRLIEKYGMTTWDDHAKEVLKMTKK